MQKFDLNFKAKEDNDNDIYDLKDYLAYCNNEYYLASLVHHIGNIQMFISCGCEILKYEIKESKILSETTILTTFSETTILTALSETTILNALPKIAILTTLTEITILTTLPEKIILSNILIKPTTSPVILAYNQNMKLNETIEIKIDKKIEDIINDIDTALENYDVGKIYEIFGDDYNIKISPINTKANGKILTYIEFGKCENILREKNGLNSSSILTIYQIEIYNNNQQSLIYNVEYAVFNENKERLDLSVCQNELIEINYQINTSNINITKIAYYSDLGIDLFNIKEEFFNDICYSYSEDDKDIILNDRITDIFQNYSVCEENCDYNEINLTNSIVSCKCSVKHNTNSEVRPPKFDKIIKDSFTDSNLAVIKCYNLVFIFRNNFQNIGFLIFSMLVFFHIPFIISYSIYNISSLRIFIYSQIVKFHYINNPPKKYKQYKNQKILNIRSQNKEITKSINSKRHIKKNISSKINLIYKTKIINNNIISINNNNNLPTISKSKLKINTPKDINNINALKLPKFKNFNKSSSIFDDKILNKDFININENNERNSTQKDHRNIKKSNKLKTSKIILSPKNYSLIQIDANNGSYKIKPINSNFLLDNFDYNMAIKYDKRNFWRSFYICILAKENIINIIFFKTPLDLKSLRICLFIFTYSCDLAFNTIFYTNQSISDKYHYQGKNLFLFTITNNLLQTIISSVVGLLLVNFFQHMIDSRGKFEEIFKDEEKKMRKNKNYKVNKQTKLKIFQKIIKLFSELKCKIFLFIICEFIIMIFFYYFVTAFCEVYPKTQNAWIYDFFTSFFISFAAEILGSGIIAIFYILSIRHKKKFLFNIALFFYNL